MRVIEQGHSYEIDNFEPEVIQTQVLNFIKKVPVDGDDEMLRTETDGTTNEEVIRVLIDRMAYLQNKHACEENAQVINKLEECLELLNKRTKERQDRGVEGKNVD